MTRLALARRLLVGVLVAALATGSSCTDDNACNGAETCNSTGNVHRRRRARGQRREIHAPPTPARL